MSTLITINVTNNSPSLQNMSFFQQPADYIGGPQPYTNSLYTAPLQSNSSSGAKLSFAINLQFYAGVQQQVTPPEIGQSSGMLSASQAIGLTPASGGTPTSNTTTMTLTPALGLSTPIPTTGPELGSFRIITPIYNPINLYNVGSAVNTLTGGITLSNFVQALPNQNIDCQPILKFYVATGTYTPGTVMDFTATCVTAAICDATTGYTTFEVIYNPDGTWTVNPFAAVKRADKSVMLLPGAEAVNAQVLNEAGSARIATGYAANFALPVTIQNLNHAGAIQVGRDYQVGPVGARPTGVTCTNVTGNSATFS